MPITVVQSLGGTATPTGIPAPFTVTPASPVGDNSAVVIGFHAFPGISAMGAFNLDHAVGAGAVQQWCRRSSAGGETSFAFSLTVSGTVAWWLWELAGIDPNGPDGHAATNNTAGPLTSLSTGTTTGPANAGQPEGITLAMHGWLNTTVDDPGFAWSGHDGGQAEDGELHASSAGSNNVDVSFSSALRSTLGPFASTASIAHADSASDQYTASMVSYLAAVPIVEVPGAVTVV